MLRRHVHGPSQGHRSLSGRRRPTGGVRLWALTTSSVPQGCSASIALVPFQMWAKCGHQPISTQGRSPLIPVSTRDLGASTVAVTVGFELLSGAVAHRGSATFALTFGS